ncbi:Hypothetical protein SCLAV_p0996 (plasmid) [Streptomyces clavuligerus]|uniref:Uncharacterized protein n=1 Tax=Streptomyces clavuligerus TaxID=1901 RepID=D5SKP0_STRCL|nr:Hypothetical protein SCLAV_p0996 [Streptomyces clavuligerus]
MTRCPTPSSPRPGPDGRPEPIPEKAGDDRRVTAGPGGARRRAAAPGGPGSGPPWPPDRHHRPGRGPLRGRGRRFRFRVWLWLWLRVLPGHGEVRGRAPAPPPPEARGAAFTGPTRTHVPHIAHVAHVAHVQAGQLRSRGTGASPWSVRGRASAWPVRRCPEVARGDPRPVPR